MAKTTGPLLLVSSPGRLLLVAAYGIVVALGGPTSGALQAPPPSTHVPGDRRPGLGLDHLGDMLERPQVGAEKRSAEPWSEALDLFELAFPDAFRSWRALVEVALCARRDVPLRDRAPRHS